MPHCVRNLKSLKGERNKKWSFKICLLQLCRAEVDVRALSICPLQELGCWAQGWPRQWCGHHTLWRGLFKKALLKGLGRGSSSFTWLQLLSSGSPLRSHQSCVPLGLQPCHACLGTEMVWVTELTHKCVVLPWAGTYFFTMDFLWALGWPQQPPPLLNLLSTVGGEASAPALTPAPLPLWSSLPLWLPVIRSI